MGTFLRHPERNALILGLLQGIPQGLTVPDQISRYTTASRELDFAFVVFFGLLAPPFLAIVSHIINGAKSPTWWVKASEYVNLPNMVFWGGLSLGLFGWYSLRAKEMSVGYSFCAFFIAGAVGFFAAGVLNKWLIKRAADAA